MLCWSWYDDSLTKGEKPTTSNSESPIVTEELMLEKMYKAIRRIAHTKSLHQFNKMLDRYTVDKDKTW
jgi:hypothetical protein